MARVTIDGLAERLGISRAAVSYALNGQPGVSDATRERVLALAMELGWQANVSARSLSRSRADAIGLVLARPAEEVGAEPYYLNALAGMEAAASADGVALLLRFVPPGGTAETDLYARWAAEHRVDGVLLVDLRLDDPRPALLEGLGLPYVVHGGRRGDGGWQFDAAREAAVLLAHLVGLGHHRIGHVTGPLALVHEQQRVAGLDQEARARGAEVVHADADYTDGGAETATARLLESDPPTAFIYSSDLMAVGGNAVLRELGTAAAVVSWDDSVLCRTAVPSITALQRDSYGSGRRSAEILLDRMTGAPERHHEWRPAPLAVRASSTAAR